MWREKKNRQATCEEMKKKKKNATHLRELKSPIFLSPKIRLKCFFFFCSVVIVQHKEYVFGNALSPNPGVCVCDASDFYCMVSCLFGQSECRRICQFCSLPPFLLLAVGQRDKWGILFSLLHHRSFNLFKLRYSFYSSLFFLSGSTLNGRFIIIQL